MSVKEASRRVEICRSCEGVILTPHGWRPILAHSRGDATTALWLLRCISGHIDDTATLALVGTYAADAASRPIASAEGKPDRSQAWRNRSGW